MILLVIIGVAATTLERGSDREALLKTFRGEFVLVTPGKNGFGTGFTMGRGVGGRDSERPPRQVTLKHDFYVARYEVPQILWEAVMGSNPSRWKGARNSVEMISYDEAVRFCERVTALMRESKLIEAKQIVRLPSEAEWEYFARAGTKTAYSFGDDPKQLGDYAWHTGNAAGNDPPVGAKKPNPWKLYDVHGYLWEWCADPWHDNYRAAPADASVWQAGGDAKHAVLRGGSWKDPANKLTSTFRRQAEKSLRDDAVGLRCVLAE
jgi:formylglycine-generating enzyme required for sulfatase activity